MMLGRAAVSGNSLFAEAVNIPVANFPTAIGDGETSIDTAANTISVTYGTVVTARRGSYAVTVGRRYRLTWNYSGSTGMSLYAGTSAGGLQYRAGVPDDTLFDFTATATALHMTFQRTAAGTTTVSSLKIQEIPEVIWTDTSLISPASWVQLSAGVTVDQETGAITIPATGTLLSARQSITTVPGKLYRLRWINSLATQCLIGTVNGGQQMKTASSSDPAASLTYEFRATTAATWIQFQRSASGTAVVSSVQVQES